jgi:hypothetical protein
MLQFYTNPETLRGATMTHVATVDTTDPEEAFRITNHIDSDWTQNPGVRALEGSHRSTSVGDLLVEGTPGGRGSKHLIVEPVGFRELTWEEICALTYCLPNK